MTGNDDQITFGRRVILNANQGVTNIIEHDVIRRDMGRVTDSIFEKLKDHYGPYSSFAGLDANKPLEDTVFTKDGANIIHAIQYSSPLEDWVRRAVEYIGKNIESAAGDGTTSSMMFTCGMLKFMSASIDSMKPISYNKLYSVWNELVEDIRKTMRAYILKPTNANDEYDEELIYNLAYSQAYTSSHGNIELSTAVAEMFKNTPPNMWKQMTFKRRHYEATKLFELHSSEAQYEMHSEVFSKTVYNKDAGRYLEYPKATFIVINAALELDGKYWVEVKKEIEASTEENPVAILCWNDFDNATFNTLMEMLTANEDGKKKYHFAVFGESPAHPKINDFTAIQAVSGVNVMEYSAGNFDGRPLILRDVYVKYEFELLQLNNLYPDENPDKLRIKERPYYNDSNHPYVREFADTIAKYIDAYESGDLTRAQQKELKSFRECYNKIVYDKELYIVIGGKTFDNLALFDVVNDVIKATKHSLDLGMVISNNKTLYQCISAIIQRLDSAPAEQTSKTDLNIKLWLARCIKNTLDMFSDVVMDQLYPRGTLGVEDAESVTFLGRISGLFHSEYDPMTGLCKTSFDHPCLWDYFTDPKIKYQFTGTARENFRSWWFSNSVDMLNYNSSMLWEKQSSECAVPIDKILCDKRNTITRMIVQPANADIVMLERFGELAIKFILTERVIVDGSAYLNKEKQK